MATVPILLLCLFSYYTPLSLFYSPLFCSSFLQDAYLYIRSKLEWHMLRRRPGDKVFWAGGGGEGVKNSSEARY